MDKEIKAAIERIRPQIEEFLEKHGKDTVAERDAVLTRYLPMFSAANMDRLQSKEFEDFLLVDNNKHWKGLARLKKPIIKDMPKLREALRRLVDDSIPVAERLDRIVEDFKITNLKQAILTPILMISFPDRYGVWNGTVEAGMRRLGVFPKFPLGVSFGQKYKLINDVLTRFRDELNAAGFGMEFDFWLLDYIWWFGIDGEPFKWTGFFESIADKLLAHKNDRTRLIEGMHAIAAKLKDSPRLPLQDQFPDGTVGPLKDICPFTVMALFNRGNTNANRQTIAAELAALLGVSEPAPDAFEGIPHVNNQRTWFFGYDKDRQPDDIHALWSVFEKALAFADAEERGGEAQNRAAFEEAYDTAAQRWGAGWNLTMGLYWIRPWKFPTLDSQSRAYIENELDMKIGKGGPQKRCNASDYLAVREALQARFEDEDCPVHSFPELSLAAWRGGTVEPGGEDDNEGDGDDPSRGASESKNYWWLNCNPKIWNINELPVGGRQQYTKYNDRGNPRKIAKYFDEVGSGDTVIAYSTTPLKEISAVCKVTRGLDPKSDGDQGKEFEFEKTEQLGFPIKLADLQRIEELEGCEPLVNNQGSLFKLTKAEYEIIRDLIDELNPPLPPIPQQPTYTKADALKELFIDEEFFDSITNRLRIKKNIIFQGPPGVGKTFIVRRLAWAFMGNKALERIEMIQFHQSYSYEDFIQGYRPNEDGGFELKNGVFFEFCRRAQADPDKDYFFIIDEINRGNLSKILGELMMLIESDKRGKGFAVPLTYARDPRVDRFHVPENLYLIGTMNTADRSLAMVDYALRRRFSFISLEPAFESPKFKAHLKDCGVPPDLAGKIIDRMKKLNAEIAGDQKNLGRGFCVGHSYFCPTEGVAPDEDWYKTVVESEIAPLLREYWFDAEKEAEKHIDNLLA